MKSKIRKLNKFISLLEHPEGTAQAIFNHRTHVLYINENWSLENIDYGNLPVNEFKEVESEKFYTVLEKLEK
jgi:hypothetical protein